MFVVAGVTGHVGSVVASELLAHHQKVKVVVRDAAKGTEWSKRGAEVAVGGLDDGRFLTGALKGATGFFTLLPPNYTQANFVATQRRTADAIAAAVRESKVPHVVLLSSIGADVSEGNGPIKGLHYLETQLRTTGTLLTALRACAFQENVGNSLKPAKESGIYPNMMPPGHTMPMIATRDIGLLAAYELMLPSTKSEVVDFAGPHYSVQEVADKLGAALGRKLQVVDVPPQAQAGALKQAGMGDELAELFAEMNAGFSTGRLKPVGDRLKVGHTPLEEVLRRMV